MSAERASDSEREAVAQRLRGAGAEGRLTLEELSERVGAAYAATTRADLEPLTRDLPSAPWEPRPAAPARSSWLISIIGGAERRGRWRLPARTTAVTLIGGPDLDLRGTWLESREAEIVSFSLIGGPEIQVPDGVEVEVSGFSLLGGSDVDLPHEPPPPGAPLIRIRAYCLIGGASVRGPGPRRAGLPRLPRP